MMLFFEAEETPVMVVACVVFLAAKYGINFHFLKSNVL